MTAVRSSLAHDWSSINWAAANREVERLQQRIFRASRQGQWRKVRSLQKLLLRSSSNLVLSVRQVTQVAEGKQTPGVDGRIARDAPSRMVLVRELQQTPMTRPAPVKRVYIPKANGKQRPLGIPTIADRIRQHVVNTALEPAWEPHVEAASYGFRPGRSAHDCSEALWFRLNRWSKGRWVLDADIRGAFDHIGHAFLLQRLGNFPARWQVGAWLTAGYVEYGTLHETTAGTPQGGGISPLLANIALDGLQQLVWDFSRQRKWHKASSPSGYFGFTRYADDFVVTASDKSRLEEVLPAIRAFLAERGLELNEEKTRIVDAYAGFDFLGFHVRKYAKGKCLVAPQKEKVLAKLRKWKEWLHHHPATRAVDVIKYLNPSVRGWANYYQQVTSSRVYSYVKHRLYRMLWSWATRRHPTKSSRWVYARYFGVVGERDWVFMAKDTDRRGRRQMKAIVSAYRPHAKHVQVRGANSPMDPTLAMYWEHRRQSQGRQTYASQNLKLRLGNRQHWLCPVCRRDLLNGEPVDQHHRQRVVDGGTDHPSNQELRHEACHYNRHGQE